MIKFKNTINVEDYLCLRKAVGWPQLNERQAETGLRNSAFIVTAYDMEVPVGTARLITDGGYMALLVDVMVRPDYQGKGIGSQIINQVMNYIEAFTSDGSCLMVNLMATAGKENFYEKFHFVERPNETMGAGMVRWFNQK